MKTRLLIIMNHLRGGGAERMLEATLRRLDPERFAVTLLACDKGGCASYAQLFPWMQVVYFKDMHQSFVRRNLFHRVPPLRRLLTRENWRRARRLVGDARFDVALSYLEGQSAQLHQGLLPLAGRNVSWVHSDFRHNPWSTRYFVSKACEKAFYHSMDCVVFVSACAQRNFLASIPLNEGVARVVHNWFDGAGILHKALEPCALPQKDKFTFVAIGRLVRAKRFDRLLHAFSLVREAGCDCTLWILGDGQLHGELLRLAQTLGLRDAVRFLGFQENPHPYVKAADAVVSSSDTEGFPMGLGEALCLGKPIVATAVCGVDELLQGAGLLVPPDEKDLADACLRLARDGALCQSLSQKAREAAKKWCDADAYMRQFQAAFLGE